MITVLYVVKLGLDVLHLGIRLVLSPFVDRQRINHHPIKKPSRCAFNTQRKILALKGVYVYLTSHSATSG